MKKRNKGLLLASMIVVFLFGLAAVYGTATDTVQEKDIKDCLYNYEYAGMQIGVVDSDLTQYITDDNRLICDNADALIDEDQQSYKTLINDSYSKSNAVYNSYINEYKLYLESTASGEVIDSLKVDAGILSMKIKSINYKNNSSVIVQTETVVWGKFIDKEEDGMYLASLLINKSTETNRLIVEDGKYKVVENLDMQLDFSPNHKSENIGTYKTINAAIDALHKLNAKNPF